MNLRKAAALGTAVGLLTAAVASVHSTSADASAAEPASPDLPSAPRPDRPQRSPADRRVGGLFAPGDSGLSRLESYRRCSVPQESYGKHRRVHSCGAFLMLRRGLAVLSAPKSGTSTARGLLEVVDGAECIQTAERRCWATGNSVRDLGPGVWLAAMVRDPFLRFPSQYEEMIARSWNSDAKRRVPRGMKFRKGMLSYRDYERRFKTRAGSAELTERFETFLAEWDPTDPFDDHLALQMPCMVSPTPPYTPFNVSHVAEATQDGSAGLLTALLRHSNPPSARLGTSQDGKDATWLTRIGGRKFARRMNTSLLSDSAVQRICRIAAVDYCCLGFKLPPRCKGVVTCRWAEPGERAAVLSEPRLLIEAVGE